MTLRGPRGRLVVGQSGGCTAVINSSLVGVIREALDAPEITDVWGMSHGIQGALEERFVDLSREDAATLALLQRTPSAALGSCRFKLSDQNAEAAAHLFARHGITYFIYIGGNDSADTARRIADAAHALGYSLRVACVPKTIDNDLPGMDHCPGYGSAARFFAQATQDSGRDTEAMQHWDPIKIVEVMGRNAGWLTAACALGKRDDRDAPHLIYPPETPLIEDRFLADLEAVYRRLGYAVVAVAETVRDATGQPIGRPNSVVALDAFGHPQLAGAAQTLCALIGQRLGLKARFDKPATIARMSIALASEVDLAEAEQAGRAAVRLALTEEGHGRMAAIVRTPGPDYDITMGSVDLVDVANTQRLMPTDFLTPEGTGITPAFRDYALPLLGDPLLPYARLRGVPVM